MTKPVAVQKDLVGNLHIASNRKQRVATARHYLQNVVWLAIAIEFETGDFAGIRRSNGRERGGVFPDGHRRASAIGQASGGRALRCDKIEK